MEVPAGHIYFLSRSCRPSDARIQEEVCPGQGGVHARLPPSVSRSDQTTSSADRAWYHILPVVARLRLAKLLYIQA